MSIPSFGARGVIALLAGKLFGDSLGDPGVPGDAAGATQARRVNCHPDLRIEAKTLEAPVVNLFVIRDHGREAGAVVAPESRTKPKQEQHQAG
jgi:hypothetical protein